VGSPLPREDALLQRGRAGAERPRWRLRTIRWRQGTKGWLRNKFVEVRCWRLTSDGQQQVGWLVGERATRGQPEERKYHACALTPCILSTTTKVSKNGGIRVV
jgi:hypothetical protein